MQHDDPAEHNFEVKQTRLDNTVRRPIKAGSKVLFPDKF